MLPKKLEPIYLNSASKSSADTALYIVMALTDTFFSKNGPQKDTFASGSMSAPMGRRLSTILIIVRGDPMNEALSLSSFFWNTACSLSALSASSSRRSSIP